MKRLWKNVPFLVSARQGSLPNESAFCSSTKPLVKDPSALPNARGFRSISCSHVPQESKRRIDKWMWPPANLQLITIPPHIKIDWHVSVDLKSRQLQQAPHLQSAKQYNGFWTCTKHDLPEHNQLSFFQQQTNSSKESFDIFYVTFQGQSMTWIGCKRFVQGKKRSSFQGPAVLGSEKTKKHVTCGPIRCHPGSPNDAHSLPSWEHPKGMRVAKIWVFESWMRCQIDLICVSFRKNQRASFDSWHSFIAIIRLSSPDLKPSPLAILTWS